MKKLSVLALLFILVPACSHIKGNFRTIKGQAYDLGKMEQVQTGMTAAEVKSLVGPPLEVTEEGGKVNQRYYMVRERIDKDKGLGVFSVEKKTTETYEVILTFDNGIVIQKRVSSVVDKPEEKKKEEKE
jgi:outer membrane protein assembly factor BamE (lipoprotein component of BamABCDE complex)